MQQSGTICIVAGGSGGHILPALTLAQSYQPSHILFFSSTKAIDSTIAPHVAKTPLALQPMPAKKFWRYPAYLLSLVQCTWQAWQVLRAQRPLKIISTGGQLGIPVCLAGKLLKIPIDVYELNARPGRAMRVLSRLATNMYYVFDECANYLPEGKRVKCDYPLRFIQGKHQTKNTNVLLVLGGSQGSHELNNLVKSWVGTKNVEVIHQVGSQHELRAWEQLYAQHDIKADVFTYREDLLTCYARATHAIARAGAGTIFELAHFGIPSVLVPLAGGAGHQVHNAQAIAKQHPMLFVVCGPRPSSEQFAHALAHLLGGANPH